MPSSRAIVTGEDYTADDINNLRDDVLTGHVHDGTEGPKVPFSNLDVSGAYGSTAPAGGTYSYDQIDEHLGDTQGVHGLSASSYICGGQAAGALVQGGTAIFDGDSKSITFPIPFEAATTPVVVATYAEARTDIANPSEASDIWVDYAATTNAGTTISTSDGGQWGGKRFNWIAIGVKTT